MDSPAKTTGAYAGVKPYDRRNYAEEIVVVDAITRGGKFMLAQVVAAFQEVEYIQFPASLENMVYLVRYGMLDLESLKIMLRTDLDYAAYNMAVGRCLNTKVSDQTCIDRSVDPEGWRARAARPEEEPLIAEFLAKRKLPLFLCHDGLANVGITLRVYPKALFIHSMRDPAALVASWFKRGFGRRWGAEPKMMSYAFQTPHGIVPRFAVDVAQDYCESGEMERIVVCIANIMRMERREYESLAPEQKKRVLLVHFESFVTDPHPELKRIGALLGKTPHARMAEILARERLPRPSPLEKNDELERAVGESLSPRHRKMLAEIRAEYRDYWRPLALARI